jgi:gamma-glutamyltranspeptidase/glutathione hydrolase
VLFDGADGAALLDPARLAERRAAIDPARRTSPRAGPGASGDTIHLCVADGEGGAVSLIQSNADGWGARLAVPGTGVLLHDRGIGFSLEAGHPAEMAAGRIPPHTLSPASVTAPDGRVAAVLGTMGGDLQPQVVLQLLARLLRHGEPPGDAVSSPRWILNGAGFSSWTGALPDLVALEDGAPGRWGEGLLRRGHRIARLPAGAKVGHAQVLALGGGVLAGAADPRAATGSTAGF